MYREKVGFLMKSNFFAKGSRKNITEKLVLLISSLSAADYNKFI